MSTTTEPVRVKAGRRRRWTTEEFLRLADLGLIAKREYLWDGEIIEAMGKNPPHNCVETILRDLVRVLFPGPERTVMADSPLKLRDGRLPQPDLMVLNGGYDVYARRLPEPADVLLVIEVSDSTYAEDAGIMLAAYASAGLPLYVIANIPARRFEVFSDPDPDRGIYRSRSHHEVGTSARVLGVEIPAGEVFGLLPA